MEGGIEIEVEDQAGPHCQSPRTSPVQQSLGYYNSLCFASDLFPSIRLPSVILQGLAYLHSRGITHGNLKPSNVLLTTSHLDRRGYSARICDFGFPAPMPSEGGGAAAG